MFSVGVPDAHETAKQARVQRLHEESTVLNERYIREQDHATKKHLKKQLQDIASQLRSEAR
jgi:hypothetical protein